MLITRHHEEERDKSMAGDKPNLIFIKQKA